MAMQLFLSVTFKIFLDYFFFLCIICLLIHLITLLVKRIKEKAGLKKILITSIGILIVLYATISYFIRNIY